MNREIKFRAKKFYKSLGGEWIYSNGYYFDGINYWFTIPDKNNKAIAFAKNTIVDPKTVRQYTNLKDKNGVEIYEGDIVTANWYDYEEPRSTITGEVIFNKGWLAYCILDEENKVTSEINGKGCYTWDIEVIGNIYENSDLLNQAQ